MRIVEKFPKREKNMKYIFLFVCFLNKENYNWICFSRPAASEQSDKLLEEILQSKTQSGIQGSSSEDVPESAENSSKLESTLTGNQTNSAETKAAGVADEQEKDCVDVASSQVTGEQETNIEGKKDDQSIESGLESSFYRGSSTFSRHSSEDLTPPHSDSEGDGVTIIIDSLFLSTIRGMQVGINVLDHRYMHFTVRN